MNKTAITFVLISDTIAFHSILTFYSAIPIDSAILFNKVLLNEGDGSVFKPYILAFNVKFYSLSCKSSLKSKD